MPRELDRCANAVCEARLNALECTHVADLHVVTVQLGRLGVDALGEQPHQTEDFVGGAAPVLGREGIERQDLDADVIAGNGDATHVFGAGVMAGQARQPAPVRPAAVTVHDDAYVRGNRFRQRVGRWQFSRRWLGARGTRDEGHSR